MSREKYYGCDYDGYDHPNRYCLNGIGTFLRKLSPGTCIVIQYDNRPPATATFIGFSPCNRTLLVSDLDGFEGSIGVTYLALNQINAVSILSNCPKRCIDTIV